MALDVEGIDYVIKATDRTQQVFRGVESGMQRLEKSYCALLGTLGISLSGGYFVSLINGSINAMDHLHDLSKATAITVENLAGLSLLAKQTGTDLDGLAKGINKMSVEMGKDPDKFVKLGVTAKGGTEALKQLADIFNSLPDINLRNALAQKIFSKSWAELAPALSEGSQGIELAIEKGKRLSKITEEMTTKSDELNDKWEELVGTGGALNTMVGAMLDPLLRLTNQMIAARDGADGFISTMARFFSIGGDQAKEPEKALAVVNKKLKALRQTEEEFAGMGLIKRIFSADDIAIVRTQIAALATQKSMLEELLGAPFPKQEPATPAASAANTAKARKFLDEEAKAAADSESAYRGLLKTLKEKLLIDQDLTEVNKLQLALDALSAKQLATITPEREKELKTLAAQVDLNKQREKQMENDAKNHEAVTKALLEGRQAMAAYDDVIGKAILAADKQIEQMKFETGLIGSTNVEREQAIFLRQAEIDKIDAQTIARGKEAIAAKHAAEEVKSTQVGFWQSVESAGHQAFLSIFDTSKSVLERIRDMLKTHLIDILYQVTMKQWMVSIVTATSGAGVAQSAFGSSAGSAAGAGLVGSVGGWMGTAAAGVPVTSTIGAVASGAGYAGAGSTGMVGTLAAIPGWGWAALGAAAIGAYILNSGDGDAQRTGNWSASLGQVGGSTQNKWFDSSTGAGTFAAELAASERAIAELLKLNTTQIDIIDTKLAALAGQQYGFGMERTDWMQSGAAQAIAADRLRTIAEGLGLSVEALAQKMVDAQKQIDLAPQKLQLEIDLMKLQGKEAEALAAERKRELAALDPLLHGLQEQIYAEQDLAAAANDATGSVSALAQSIDDVRSAAGDAVDAQIDASRSASQAARQAADAYRQVNAALGDAVRQLRGGNLSPLLPGQRLGESRATLEAVYGQAATGDAAALAKLPQVATDFLTASRDYNASSSAYTADFDMVMKLLGQAQVVSTAMVNWEEYHATLLETQTGILEAIKAQLALPSPDAAILTQQIGMLGTIAQLLQEQTTQVIAGNTITIDQTGKIVTGNALVGTQTGQIITGNATQDVIKNITALNTTYSEQQLAALVASGGVQSDSLTALVTGNAMTISLLQQLVAMQGAAAMAAYDTKFQEAVGTIWGAIQASGGTLSDFDAQFAAWKAANPMPSYAVGTSFVPNTGPALLHAGEAVLTVPQAANWRSGNGGITSADLAALRQEVKDLRTESRSTPVTIQESGRDTVVALRGGLATLSEEMAALRSELRRLTAKGYKG